MLVQTASGLERFMAGSKGQVLKESVVAQISAYVYYNAHVISKLTNNVAFQNKFREVIFNQIDKDFGEYIDAQARTRPRSLHHVYEWDRVGDKTARLFKLNKLESRDLSFQISYEFLPSKSFAKGDKNRRHVFVEKASVMEAGMPLKIAPRHAERLVFDVNGYTVYMPKGASVTVRKPGGAGVKNSFVSAYSRFFASDLVNLSIKKSGFQKTFNISLTKALQLPNTIKRVSYSFSPNVVRNQADSNLTMAFGGAL